MKGTSHMYLDSSGSGDLNLLRTALVYMIPLRDSIDTNEWRYTEHENDFIGGVAGSLKLYDRIMLPGKYKMNEQAVYLFTDSGDISNIFSYQNINYFLNYNSLIQWYMRNEFYWVYHELEIHVFYINQ